MKIIIKDLKISTIIGILEKERENPQEILINATFEADEFIDYALACELICDQFNKNKFMLLEDAILFFQNFFKSKFTTLNSIYFEILKLEILKNAIVGVSDFKKFD